LGPEPEQFPCCDDSDMLSLVDGAADAQQDPHLCYRHTAVKYASLPIPNQVGCAAPASTLVGDRGDSIAVLADGLAKLEELKLAACIHSKAQREQRTSSVPRWKTKRTDPDGFEWVLNSTSAAARQVRAPMLRSSHLLVCLVSVRHVSISAESYLQLLEEMQEPLLMR
jgi:hypothetical protein